MVLGKKLTYCDYEEKYPDSIILRKEGCFYTAHNESAEIISGMMNYRLGADVSGKAITSGLSITKITDALDEMDYNYLVIEDDVIVSCHCGDNPFGNSIK